MDFRVGVSVELLDRVSGGLMNMVRSLNTAHRAASALQTQLHGITTRLAIGGALTGVGVGIAAGLFKAAEAAGDLEIALKGVQVAGRFTSADMKDLSNTVFQVSSMAATSAEEVARFAATIESSTGLSKKQLQDVLPVFTKFADVMHFGPKGVPFEQSIKAGVQFAHLIGKYDSKGLTGGLDSLFIASQFTAGTPGELIHSMQNFAPVARTMGVPLEKQIMMAALFENMGFGAKGGTVLKNLMLNSMPGVTRMNKFMQGKHGHALHELGLIDGKGHSTIFEGSGKNQHLNVDALISRLGAAAGHMSPVELAANTQAAFNMRGMTGAMLLSQPENAARLQEMLTKMAAFQAGTTGGKSAVEQAQGDLFGTLNVQLRTLKTNLENIFLKALLPKLPEMARWVEHMAGFAAKIVSHLTPGWATAIIASAAALSGLTIIGGIATSLTAIMQLVGLLGGAAGVAGAAGGGATLIGALTALTGPVGLAIAAIAGLAAIIGYLALTSKDTGHIYRPDHEELPADIAAKAGVKGYGKLTADQLARSHGPMVKRNAYLRGIFGSADLGFHHGPAGGLPALDDPEVKFFGDALAGHKGKGKGGNVTVHVKADIKQNAGEDSEAFANRMATALAHKIHTAARSAGPAGGIFESPELKAGF